jgi:hypothetical protein
MHRVTAKGVKTRCSNGGLKPRAPHPKSRYMGIHEDRLSSDVEDGIYYRYIYTYIHTYKYVCIIYVYIHIYVYIYI